MTRFSLFFVSVLLAIWILPTQLFAASDYHYLCRVTLSVDGVTLDEAKRVEGAIPQRRGPAQHEFRFHIEGPKGVIMHKGSFSDPRKISGAFESDKTGKTEHFQGMRNSGTFFLRLPPLPDGVTLVVEKRSTRDVKDGWMKIDYQPFARQTISLNRVIERTNGEKTQAKPKTEEPANKKTDKGK